LLFPARTELLERLQTPPLTQRTAPVTVCGILSVTRLDFNHADTGVQMKPIPVPMYQPLLALGGKPRRGLGRVLVCVLLAACASTPGLLPSLQPQLGRATETIPQGPFSWCLCLCRVVIHFIREEPYTLIMGELSRCTHFARRHSDGWKPWAGFLWKGFTSGLFFRVRQSILTR
jgi:hypothetical protein